jgi:hypothetical protein
VTAKIWHPCSRHFFCSDRKLTLMLKLGRAWLLLCVVSRISDTRNFQKLFGFKTGLPYGLFSDQKS